jgi:hypothetical protein
LSFWGIDVWGIDFWGIDITPKILIYYLERVYFNWPRIIRHISMIPRRKTNVTVLATKTCYYLCCSFRDCRLIRRNAAVFAGYLKSVRCPMR